jgi:hypothetical protein
MADRVEKLGIVVETTGIAEAKAEIISLGPAGEQSAAKVRAAFEVNGRSAQVLSGQLDNLTRMTQTWGQQDAAAQRFARELNDMIQQQGRMAGATAQQIEQLSAAQRILAGETQAATVAAEKTVIAQQAAGAASGTHGLQLGRVNGELGTFAGRLLGVNTASTRLVAQIGGAVAGYGVMIAVLGGVAIAIEVVEKLAGYNKHAAEEQERLTQSLEKWYDTERRGIAGERIQQIEAEIASLRKLNDEYLKLRQNAPAAGIGGEGGATIDIGAILAPQNEKKLHEGGNALLAAQREVTAKLEEQQVSALASLVANHRATEAEQERANQALIFFQKRLRDNLNIQGDQTATLPERAQIAAMVDELNNALHPVKDLRDAQRELAQELKNVADAMDRIQKSLKDTDPEWTLNRRNYEQIIADLKELNAVASQVGAIGARNKAATDAEDKARKDRLDKEQKYQEDLRKIWRDGIGSIVTDGMKSFQDFSEDAYRLFTRLMDRMKAAGKDSGLGYNLLGLGAAAVGGYSVGSSSGSAMTGIIGGTITGALATGNPIGALVGGLSGLIGGLIGGSAAAKQRKEAEDQLRDSLTQSLTKIRVQMGQLPEIEGQIADAQAQFAARAKQIDDAYSGKKNQTEREQLLAANSKLEQEYIAWLRKQDEATKAATKAAEEAAAAQQALADAQKNASAQGNYQLRFLNATGQSDAAFNLGQQLEIDQAIADGLDAISIRLLTQAQTAEKAQREQQKQTALLTDQLSAAQQQYDALKGVVDNLTAFKSSLAIGQYSPLSPRQQLDAARAQLNSVYQAALGGDQTAASQFSGVAQSFLDASRKYGASGPSYVMDFTSVGTMTDQLTQLYGRQMSDAQRQVSLLQQQLDVLKSIDASTITLAQRPLTPSIPTPTPVGGSGPRIEAGAGADASVAVTAAGFNLLSAKLDTLTAAVETNTTLTKRSLDSLTATTANRRTA